MTEKTTTELRVAWIAQGRLFVQTDGQPLQEIESEFARQSQQRNLRDSELNAWKGRSGVWGNLGMQPPGAAPWEDQDPQRQIRFVAVARGPTADEIFYVLDMGTVGGLFCYNLKEHTERRLVHRQGFVLKDVSRHSADGELAVSLPRDDGTIGLKITRHDGLFGHAITMSDSLDESPAWLPDGSKRLVFQSSAIGRDEHGYAIGQSPFRIEKLDLATKEVTAVFEEEGYDLLQPRILSDDSLICIRRPHQAMQRPQLSFSQYLQDVVLFPYRLLRTFVHFFHFMSMMFTGKPLISAGGPVNRRRKANPYLMLWGQAIDTHRILSRERSDGPRTPLVPDEWKLMRRDANGMQSVLADNVLAWDLCADESVCYTDGRRVYHRPVTGSPRVVAEADLIERVAVLS
ncbi:MAG: hypothetical protein R3C19_01095 [Planctomycetaceae bacterium]